MNFIARRADGGDDSREGATARLPIIATPPLMNCCRCTCDLGLGAAKLLGRIVPDIRHQIVPLQVSL